MSEKTVFEKLSQLDVGKHIERKGKFSYLSWPWAVKTLREQAPDATWEVMKFDGKPFCATETGYFVEVAVTVSGVTLSQIHPVLDNNNRTIAAPNAFQINTSIQRCLVKAIALHGLGLYIYAGEDLPEEDQEEKRVTKITPTAGALDSLPAETQEAIREMAMEIIAYGDADNIAAAVRTMEEAGLEQDEKVALWSLLPSKVRSSMKKYKETERKAA